MTMNSGSHSFWNSTELIAMVMMISISDDPTDRLRRPSRALSQSNILTASGDSTDEKVDVYQPPRVSIFNRPGLGSIAFRLLSISYTERNLTFSILALKLLCE